jgi:hypothetical protein
VRSERMLIEQLEYSLLFRWFVGLSANEPVWHPTVFTKNGYRLPGDAVAQEFFSLIQRKGSDHDPLNPPPVDGGGNPTVNWHNEKRSNQTHEFLTDAMARLHNKDAQFLGGGARPARDTPCSAE